MTNSFDEKLEQFRLYVWETYHRSISPLRELIAIRIKYQEHRYHKGRIEMVLLLDSPDSVKTLKETRTIKWLDDAQHWLDEFQGPMPSRESQFMEEITKLNNAGISHQKIANLINDHIVSLLKEHVDQERLAEQMRLTASQLDLYLEEKGQNPYPLSDAIELMVIFGLGYEKIFEWRDEGIRNVRENSHPIFPPDRPINHDRVGYQIGKWKKRSA